MLSQANCITMPGGGDHNDIQCVQLGKHLLRTHTFIARYVSADEKGTSAMDLNNGC